MTRTYQRKFLDDGVTPNPKYKPDRGDRHKNKGDRHLTNESSHRDRSKKKFIAIDGEGINTEMIVGYSKTKSGKNIPVYEHLYVLLVASSSEYIINEQGLSTTECFEFLLKLAKDHPDTILVCYVISYEVTKMLKDVPSKILSDLYESEDSGFNATAVYYHGTNGYTYKIAYKPRRSFTITRLEKPLKYISKTKRRKDGTKYTKYEPEIDYSVTLWDVSGFFKERFVDALGDKEVGYFHDHIHIEGGHEIIKWNDGVCIDLTKMKAMKNRRRSFTREQIEEEILPYCKDEVKALQRLMERLREILEKANLLPFQSQWYGAGACANTVLQRYHVKEHMQETDAIR